MEPPLALDIDGTLTTPDDQIDPRAFEVLPSWEAPIVLATGKSFPYPIALCHFLGIPEQVVAENGGVVCADGQVADTTNRWRETELAARVDADEQLLRSVADEFDLEVVDTGYAYHLKTPGVEKGTGLRAVADIIGVETDSFVAVGDSENDVSLFEAAGASYAVGNADAAATAAAETVVSEEYFEGTLRVLESLQSTA